MEIQCQSCDCSFSFEGQPPRFCQNCGKPFSQANVQLSQQLAAADEPSSVKSSDQPSTASGADVTIAPSSPKPKPTAQPVGIGEIVGPYQLVRWLGSGGMGNVWEAIESQTGRRVALKRLAKSMVSDESYVKRFVREARLAAQISHPKVTFIYGAGNDAGQPYIAMELMPGKTMADKVEEEGPLDYSIAVDGIIDVVEGLTAAHKLGMIHRDVKPSNCFLDTDESVKIGDFGLSKSLTATSELNLTQTGTFMGTPSYAAPEQIRGGDLDGRTDIYAIGATLFFLLTGKTPFKGDAMSVTAQIISDKPPSCKSINPEIPKDLANVIAKCLEKDSGKRFQDLEQLKLALAPFATQREAIADLGRRLAAYMIDQTLIQTTLTIGIFVWTLGSVFYAQFVQHVDAEEVQRGIQAGGKAMMFRMAFVSWGLTLLYYAFCESRFGRGVGKRMMGLCVVNREGQRVGFWRALGRACIVPGAFGFPLLYGIWQSYYGEMPLTAEDHFINLLTSITLAYVPTLFLLSTMRTSNRLAGVHGLLSGTRVARVQSSEQKTFVPLAEPQSDKLAPMQFGPYESTAMMGESRMGKVYLGHDKQLRRDVWVVLRPDGKKPTNERINLARNSRQRWLEGGVNEEGNSRWDAFEAIHGLPIQSFVGMQNKADWSVYGSVMIDIVDELLASLNDNTLPQTLTLPQVWLDKDGHAQLLDKQLVTCVTAGLPGEELAEGTPLEKSVDLIQQLGDLFRRTQVLPASVQDFVAELVAKPKTQNTLVWAKTQLTELSKHTTGLSWDSRLGILSASVGIEFVIYGLVSACIFLFCFIVAPLPNAYRFEVGVVLGLVFPVALGVWFRGGPVFNFMKIQVCNSRGRSASRLIVGVRAALSWLPIVSMVGVFFLLLMLAESETTHVEPAPGSMADSMKDQTFAIVIILVFLASSFLVAVGMFVAVLSPKRGLVDWLLRTRLMPK